MAADEPASPTPGGQQQRRGRCRRCGRDRGTRHRLIGAHRGGGLDPHPHVVGFVQRDRNGVDAKEVRAEQHGVRRVVQRRVRPAWAWSPAPWCTPPPPSRAEPPPPRCWRSPAPATPDTAHARPRTVRRSVPPRRRPAPRPTRWSIPRRQWSIRRLSDCHAPAAASSEPGPGPLLSSAECTSGGRAIQMGAVTVSHRRSGTTMRPSHHRWRNWCRTRRRPRRNGPVPRRPERPSRCAASPWALKPAAVCSDTASAAGWQHRGDQRCGRGVGGGQSRGQGFDGCARRGQALGNYAQSHQLNSLPWLSRVAGDGIGDERVDELDERRGVAVVEQHARDPRAAG